MRTSLVFIIIGLTLAGALRSTADPVERGKVIVGTARARTSGFGSLSAELEMTLENRRGQTHTRIMRFHILERDDGGRYSLCRVEAPPDVRGTILLAHRQPKGNSDQWLYLPSLHRTRRIAAQARSGSFMGSEFTYEDLIGHPLDAGTHRWLRDERLGDLDCHVLEWTPLDPRASGYTRQIAWIDTRHFRLWRVDYYNPRNELHKTLTLNDYRLTGERIWYAHSQEMRNHLSGNRTRLQWSNVRIDTRLDPALFDPERLGTHHP